MVARLFAAVAGAALLCSGQFGPPSPEQQKATAEDHRDMLQQLGIKALRPGPSGNEKAANHANYDESLANPHPNYPEILKLENGRPVASPDMWWSQRRPEIVELFNREVFGRVPASVPSVKWTVKQVVEDKVGPYPVIAKELRGVVDNTSHPEISVEIEMVLITPAWTRTPVPTLIMFGRAALPSAPLPAAFARFADAPQTDPPASVQLIGAGWGYAMLSPTSVQADNGAGLTKGIVGLVNKGQRRTPEDWGALRAWAWGASRALDYLETDKAVDAKRVGIEGVSRYGKAALVTMAYDRRFAVVLVGSSGEGGAKPHRRNFGEAVENLTAAGEYHWMAGNFLKYGAAEANFGSKNAGDIPVDSHQLIALCAPRPTFISYGIPEKGDARWLDQQGSYMATVAAGAVWRLLGAKDIGVTEDYRTAKMPPVNKGLLEGHLAWRQHEGGHTDLPNQKYFIPWASKHFGYKGEPAPPIPADVAAPRLDPVSIVAHARLLEKTRAGKIDVYFVGDSITRRWGATDYPQLLENWKANFSGWNAANFGWGADRTQNILWRLRNGELEGIQPKIVVVQAGTNNIGNAADAAEIARGIQAIVGTVKQKVPDATVILTGLFNRYDRPGALDIVREVNRTLAASAEGKSVRFLDINGKLTADTLDPDRLHLGVTAYQIWADALKPIFTELLGPAASQDQAPPASGVPPAD